jgi:Uma2 family endonuclease
MNVLIESINNFFTTKNDYFVGGNMFIYYSLEQLKNKDFRGPDFFVVLDVANNPDRQGWVVWEEKGRYPDVIIELMSSSTAKIDQTTKKEIYERIFRTSDYFIFDPFNPNSLQGWSLNENQKYKELNKNNQGWLWCEKLGLWLGIWAGIINNVQTQWLRFYHPDGSLVLLPSEAAQQQAQFEKKRAQTAEERAQTAEERAQRLAARLKELGEDPTLI